MASKKSRINGYKIKRFFFLLFLLSILGAAFWSVLKRVSPVFKPEEKRATIQRDYRGAIKIDIQPDVVKGSSQSHSN